MPLTTRVLLAREFGISKVGTTHVIDNQVVSDGYNVADVERAFTLDAVQKFVGVDETDYAVLWGMMVEKVLAPIAPETITESTPQVVINEVIIEEKVEEKPEEKPKTKKKATKKVIKKKK